MESTLILNFWLLWFFGPPCHSSDSRQLLSEQVIPHGGRRSANVERLPFKRHNRRPIGDGCVNVQNER